jgi:hypothetical protein
MQQKRHLRPFRANRHRTKILTTAALSIAGILSLNGGATAWAEDAGAMTNGNEPVSAETDAKVSGTGSGKCTATASASASSTSTADGRTVTKKSEKFDSGPCGAASARASATAGGQEAGGSSDGEGAQ